MAYTQDFEEVSIRYLQASTLHIVKFQVQFVVAGSMELKTVFVVDTLTLSVTVRLDCAKLRN